MSATIEVEGLKQMVKALRQSGTGLNKAIRTCNLAVTQELAEKMRPKAPRGTSAEHAKHPGALAASIRGTAAQVRGLIKIGGGKIAYAAPVIFGWPRHHIEPNPFYQGVLDEAHETMGARYLDAVSKTLQEYGLK